MRFRLTVTAAGLILVLTMVGANAIPPPIQELLIFPNGTSPGCYLFPNGERAYLGAGIDISNSDSVKRTVKQTEGFWSAKLAPGKRKSVPIRAAGTYLQTCDGGLASAPVSVQPLAPAHPGTTSFTVTWASSGAGSKWKYNVQYRIGAGKWRGWKSNTSLRSATFNGTGGKVYYFRARVRKSSSGKRTDWSPPVKVVT